MADTKVIGIDLGATNIRGAVVKGSSLSDIVSVRIHSDGEVEDVLGDIYQVVESLIGEGVEAIGIGGKHSTQVLLNLPVSVVSLT